MARVVGDGPVPLRAPPPNRGGARPPPEGGGSREHEDSLPLGRGARRWLDEPFDVPAPIATGKELVQAELSHLLEHIGRLRDPPEEEDVEVLGQDRKSTRLNSSHLVISYAVFCL